MKQKIFEYLYRDISEDDMRSYLASQNLEFSPYTLLLLAEKGENHAFAGNA